MDKENSQAVIGGRRHLRRLGIVAAGNLYFTHNAMVEATRRGARYASTQAAATPAGTVRTTSGCDTTGPQLTAIRYYAIYGNAAGTGDNLVNLQPSNICVTFLIARLSA